MAAAGTTSTTASAEPGHGDDRLHGAEAQLCPQRCAASRIHRPGHASCASAAMSECTERLGCCGYPADSSDFAAGAAGAAASTPTVLLRLSDRGLRLTPSPATAGDPASPCVAGQCHLHRQCDLAALRRAPARMPLGRGVRPPTVSAQAYCNGPRLPPVRDSLSLRWAAGWAALSVGSGQLCRSVHASGL